MDTWMSKGSWVGLSVVLLLGFMLYQCAPLPLSSSLSLPTPVSTGEPRASAPDRQAPSATAKLRYATDLPDPKLTPGDVLAVTKADICVAGYARKVRNVPAAVKTKAYTEYGITTHQPGAYEVDHLISLELGGSNSLKNLWPESYQGDWNAHVKDKLENKLHALVCAGQIDLKTAQHEIATNWIAAYQKYLGQ
jgi:hypothetical protein